MQTSVGWREEIVCNAAFSVQNKHLRSHNQFIVQVQKQESPTVLYIYFQQLRLQEEISATVEERARGSITEGKMLKNTKERKRKKKEWHN